MTTFLRDYRPIFMTATFALLGVAFFMTYRPRPAADGRDAQGANPGGMSRMMTFNKFMLWGATAVSVVLLFFPQAVTGFFAPENEVAPEMHQTLIKVEGMT
jgi:hypothetical protein